MSRLLEWWNGRKTSRQISSKTTRLSIQLRRTGVRLQRKQAELNALRKQTAEVMDAMAAELAEVERQLDQVKQEIHAVEKQQHQYETELELLRSRVRVAEDVTIPGLVAANRLVLERYDADTAIQVKRQVLQG